jgi:hypothetical protein
MISITTRNGKYRAIDWSSHGVEEHIVERCGDCSCGSSYTEQCEHSKAVAEYIRKGGRKATAFRRHILDIPLPEECPVCKGAVDAEKPFRSTRWFWKCRANNAHFWEWLGNGRVRGFLTQPHENKVGGYYTQTWEEKLAPSRQIDAQMKEYFNNVQGR